MMKTLLILGPPLAALAMVMWLQHARRAGGRRWILHWLAALLPVGVMLAIAPLIPFADIPDLLFVLAMAGAAAFAGGGLYLMISALAGSERAQVSLAGMGSGDRRKSAWTEDEIYYYHHYWYRDDD